MGQSSSKTKEFRCTHCGFNKPPRSVGQAPNTYLICTRCHGLAATASASASSASSSSSSKRGYDVLDGNADDTPSVRLPLDRIHIAPFHETLPVEHQRFAQSINYEQEMLDTYLTPFFNDAAAKYPGTHSLFVQIGSRFQIDSVDFKVVSCYPPSGYVSPKTSIRCMIKPLSAVASIAKVHILPVLATLVNNSAQGNGEASQLQLEPTEIFRDYVLPWIHDNPQNGARANGAPAAASSSSSSSSAPAASSSSSSSSSSPSDHEPKHIVEGDLFVSRGIQFKVLSCMPTNGVLTSDTEVFNTGPPVDDIGKMQIHPIYESLPNSEKQWTGAQFFQKYLMPFFQGRFQFVKKGDVLAIDGVDFKVVACEPTAGLVTSDTLIFNDGPSLRSEDLRRQQMEEDEAMARHMQLQEEQVHRPQQRGGGHFHGHHTTPEELRVRLAQVLRLMPPNDPHRAVVQRLFDQLGQMPPGAQLHTPDRGMMSLLRSAAGQPPENRGASQADIEALPTRIHRAPAQAPSPDGQAPPDEKERVTCMVCLMEYEDADELRTLPCFHSFHSGCVDTWLRRKAACPVCRYPITPNAPQA